MVHAVNRLFFTRRAEVNFLHKAITSCYNDSTLVAIPHYFDIGVLYYRDDLLKKYSSYKEIRTKLKKSITWKDFIKLSNKFKNSPNHFMFFRLKIMKD